MLRPTVVGLAAVVAAGCPANQETGLHRVAKDWSQTIRASQIIPVYPLTEDLFPGDVFLVQRTVDQQSKAYRETGFLPLDHHVDRITPTGYRAFYRGSFEAGANNAPGPATWMTGDPAWRAAPNAAFPTYSFSVSRGAGFNLALPVSGVSAGLSLLGAEAATGTITIAETRTYGVDTRSLVTDVGHWARENRDLLRAYAPDPEGGEAASPSPNYLRVVTRVFLAGKVNISLQASRNAGGEARGAAPSPLALLPADQGAGAAGAAQATAANYSSALDTLNRTLGDPDKGAALGAGLRIVAASARSISLDETFRRPLVIGYLGFDMRILPGGRLGPPFPTHAVLEEGKQPAARPFLLLSGPQADFDRLIKSPELKGRSPAFYRRILTELGIDPPAGGLQAGNRGYLQFRRAVSDWKNAPDISKKTRTKRIRKANRILREHVKKEGD